MKTRRIRGAFLAAVLAALCQGAAWQAAAADGDKIVLGKAVPIGFIFMPADVGDKLGLFKKAGLDVEVQGFGGDAKLNQAMIAGAVDIGIAGATNIAFAAQGAPVTAVAAMSNSAEWLGLVVPAKSSIRTVVDLKGRKISVTTPSSLTYYVVRELSRQQGWGPGGIVTVPLGGPSAYFAAMKVGEVDGVTTSVENGYLLEEKHEARVLLTYDAIGPLESMAVFATRDMIEKRPEVLRRFLRSWLEAIAFIKSHEAETLAVIRGQLSDAAAHRVYGDVVRSLSDDGRFPRLAMEKLVASLPELGLTSAGAKLDPASLYNEAFLPAQR